MYKIIVSFVFGIIFTILTCMGIAKYFLRNDVLDDAFNFYKN